MGRDNDIGIPDEKTLNDIHDKLDVVEKKVDDNTTVSEEVRETLKQTKTATELILGAEVEEAE